MSFPDLFLPASQHPSPPLCRGEVWAGAGLFSYGGLTRGSQDARETPGCLSSEYESFPTPSPKEQVKEGAQVTAGSVSISQGKTGNNKPRIYSFKWEFGRMRKGEKQV